MGEKDRTTITMSIKNNHKAITQDRPRQTDFQKPTFTRRPNNSARALPSREEAASKGLMYFSWVGVVPQQVVPRETLLGPAGADPEPEPLEPLEPSTSMLLPGCCSVVLSASMAEVMPLLPMSARAELAPSSSFAGRNFSISSLQKSESGGRMSSLHKASSKVLSQTSDTYNSESAFRTPSPSSDPQLLTEIARTSAWKQRLAHQNRNRS